MTSLLLANEADFESRSLKGAQGLAIRLLPNGCIYSIEHGEILINQLLACPVLGGVQRIYVRVHGAGGIESACIVGPDANCALAASDNAFAWSGEGLGLRFCCTCTLHPHRNAWFFRVEITNATDRLLRCGAILVQDVGLATRGQVRNNELFTSQYIDHFATEHPRAGFVLMSRQNLPQPGEKHPWLMQGCFPKAVGFTTDGIDFFGAAHRADGRPAALARANLGTRVRQYEIGYTAIQSDAIELKPASSFTWTFFSDFDPHHPAASSSEDLARVDALTAEPFIEQAHSTGTHPQHSLFQDCPLLSGEDVDEQDLPRIFPGPHRHIEKIDGRVVSFFYSEEARHVVTRAKEIAMARSHGSILRAGPGLMPDSEILSSACYAPGVFASQMAFGNAGLCRLLSGVRDPLNVVHSSGLRMFVRFGASERWQLLAVPSAFEMALNECGWHYKLAHRAITIRCIASESEPAMKFDVRVEGAAVEFLVCGEISAGPMEYDTSPRVEIDRERKRITVRPDPESMVGKKQPALAFQIAANSPEEIHSMGGDEALFQDNRSRGNPYVTIQSRPANRIGFTISCMSARPKEHPGFWKQITANLRVRHESNPTGQEIQDALTWFARDAVIHLSSPRGLDQPNGGAWGVRDVCQGAVEFLLSYGHGEVVAEILRRLFSQQYHGRWDWPQWFMFPPFEQIQSPHSHGDVAIWPLKALCDYLEETDDQQFLAQALPYTHARTFQKTDNRQSVLEHVDLLLERLRWQFLPGLSLPRYGEGDWDDSLQPADPALRERMVSSWTTELLYDTLKRYAVVLKRIGDQKRAEKVQTLAAEIQRDFQRYLMPDGIVAGFAIFGANSVEYLLHPSDSRTGLRYRLIPMTRGILSEIFTPEQARRHVDLIHEHLLYPDGVRLMDRPTRYSGGVERIFRRSESAAFFGREIGLQYAHAHLRYAEAMARLGRADDLWRALRVVNPIAVNDLVPHSNPRQRNCYFSSSDADFATRYEASDRYGALRRGEVSTSGGWRVYSSGPGIYTNLVIRHLFGLRRYFDQLEFDPVISRELEGTTCELEHRGRRFVYQFGKDHGSRGIRINGRAAELSGVTANPYRSGGIRISLAAFELALQQEGENHVEITI